MGTKVILSGYRHQMAPMITSIMAIHQLLEEKDICTIYPCDDRPKSVKRKGKPKITLFFLEDSLKGREQARPRRKQRATIGFRLMDESPESLSKANAAALGERVKQIFGANGGFVWGKGKTMYSYSDWDMGYQLQLLCRSETEAKRIVSAVMAIQSHTPDWKWFNTIQNDQEADKYPEDPGTQQFMGETVYKLLARPNVNVRFQYAYLSVKGLARPITIYDRVHRRVGALVI